jgi:predicted enzyme related to lactoylglutathione lyase
MDVLSRRCSRWVRDLARSREFYERTLGLSISREYGAGGVATGIVYFLGGGFLEVTARQGSAGPGDVALWVQVGDVRAEERRLVAAGVTVRKPAARMPWGLVECWIEDPDGAELRLVEVPEGHPIRTRLD